MSIEFGPITNALRGEPERFAIGEVVRLKSGGPSMTIEQAGGKAIRCGWFNGGGGYNSGVFHAAALVRV